MMVFRRLALGLFTLIGLLGATGVAPAQIVWQHTFLDSGTGYNDPTAAGATTVGALRQASAIAATNYLGSVLDGRGTVRLQWNQSDNAPGSSTLASFGFGSVFTTSGSFQGGPVYQRARSNISPNTGQSFDGSGRVNFGRNWHYDVAGTNTTLNNNNLDLVSVLIHEVAHSLGFSDFSGPDGRGLTGNAPGTTGTYSSFDRHLQRGNAAGTGAMLHSDITQSNYGSFNTAVGTGAYTGGNTQDVFGATFTNNTTNGLYFNGTYANEVFGGTIPLYSPTSYDGGSSTSHVNVGPGATYGSGAIGLMNNQIGDNTVRRFQPYEIAMLMDMGWNVYNWDNAGGSWLAGVNNLADSNWRTDRGIVDHANFAAEYNTFGNPNQAPILPVHGQITSNIVLNFGGTTAYTSTNDIGTVRLSRLNLDSSASGGGSTITGGSLLFGQNSDGTASALAPKMVQRGSGAFTIGSNIQTVNTTGAPGGGHTGLILDGGSVTVPGGQPTGMVTISGVISGTGGLTKQGGGNYTLTGANTYTGTTSVSSGTLFVSGAGSFANSPTIFVNAAGTLNVSGVTSGANFNNGRFALAAGQTLRSASGGGTVVGAVEARSGSTVSPGNTPDGPGTLTINGDLKMSAGSAYLANLNGSTHGQQYDRVVVNGVLDLTGATLQAVLGNGYTPAASDRLFIFDNNGTDAVIGTFDGLANGSPFQIGSFTAFIYYDGNLSGLSLSGGNDVVLSFTPVPEPGLVLVAAAGGLGLLRLTRRRRIA